jgi:hypothetical protein
MTLLDTNPHAIRAEAPSPFWTLTVVSIIFVGLGMAWALVDARQVNGAAVWMKPLKFSLSFVVLFGTIALIEPRLSGKVREGWPLRIIGWVMAAAFLSEMAYITYQAALAEPSHFNVATPFNRMMYEVVMAGGAVSLVVCIGLIGWLVKSDPSANLGPGLREGIVVGFMTSFVLTMITAGYLGANGGHFVGPHPAGAAVLPLFGWSGVTGDLRAAHFFALHAMQVLPLLGLWLDLRGVRAPVRSVQLWALLYCTLTFAIFAQAVMGLPLIPLK